MSDDKKWTVGHYATRPEGRCCENGFFGQTHDCCKRTGHYSEQLKPTPQKSAPRPNVNAQCPNCGSEFVWDFVPLSAYAALERENAELRKDNSAAWMRRQLDAEIDKLQAELAAERERADDYEKAKRLALDMLAEARSEVERLDKMWTQCKQGYRDVTRARDRYRAALERIAANEPRPQCQYCAQIAREALK